MCSTADNQDRFSIISLAGRQILQVNIGDCFRYVVADVVRPISRPLGVVAMLKDGKIGRGLGDGAVLAKIQTPCISSNGSLGLRWEKDCARPFLHWQTIGSCL
jgi:hypothetical protein